LTGLASAKGGSVPGFAGIDFVGRSEMFPCENQIILSEIYQAQMVERSVESRIKFYAPAKVSQRDIGSTIFEIGSADQVVHLRGRFER
jgi:hypothetical protein